MGIGQVLLGVSLAVLGALTLGVHDFAAEWLPIVKGIAWRSVLTIPSGIILLGGGLALLVPRLARPASLALAIFLLLLVLLLKVPQVARHPLVEATWEDMSETLVQLAGAWTIFSMLGRPKGGLRNSATNFGNIRAGQVLFALALPALGLSHMIYLDQTAPLIPSWLPFHVPLAYFTGAAYIAAAAGILFGVLPRLAATLVAIMVSLFTLLVWVPKVIAAPANLSDWAEICISAAITGAAWVVAESYRSRRWNFARSG
jgi:uncharacterized membrane protein YphA (DoxX/SURF4 family)